MKLLTKLTLFVTLSKLVIVGLFVWWLPFLVDSISSQYTNYYLKQQKEKVLQVIDQNGIDYYLQGDSSYGSYTMLKEEYISLEPANAKLPDSIQNARRLVENDTLSYRILTHTFSYQGRNYMLEVGKTVATISQYNRPLQRMALYVLGGLIAATILIDLIYTRLLLRPLRVIIRSKLVNRKFPFREHLIPIKTSTTDFRYLDQSLIGLMNKIREDFEREREFTSNASHELMTPISILQNKMENMMMEPGLSDEAQDRLMGMMKTLNRLKKIVQSLLLISRIENDQYLKSETVGLSQLINEVAEELEDRATVKGVRLTQSVAHTIEIRGVNKDLLFQLIYNLVNNAIRYNRENGTVHISGEPDSPGNYRLYIDDSGTGIPPEMIGSLFDRFKKSADSEEGYGLGLSIVRSIADYHQIHLRVSSEVDRGSRFAVIFPAAMVVVPPRNGTA